MEDVAAADRVAGHQRDHRLGHGAHVALQLEHVEAGHAAPADVAGLAAHLLVPPGAEGPLAVLRRSVAGEEDDADVGVLPGVAERLLHLQERVGPEGVADLGAIEGDAGDAVALVVRDVLVRFDFLPVGLGHLDPFVGS